jgi:ArsR family transcriptional regulator
MGTPLVIVERQLGERCCDRSARPSIPARDAQRLADEMQLLGHPVRLQLLDVLARNEGRVCVCDLEAAVPVKQPTVSHHLRILREAGLIDAERVGQWMYYRLRRDALGALRRRVGAFLESFV